MRAAHRAAAHGRHLQNLRVVGERRKQLGRQPFSHLIRSDSFDARRAPRGRSRATSSKLKGRRRTQEAARTTTFFSLNPYMGTAFFFSSLSKKSFLSASISKNLESHLALASKLAAVVRTPNRKRPRAFTRDRFHLKPQTIGRFARPFVRIPNQSFCATLTMAGRSTRSAMSQPRWKTSTT